MKYLTIDSKVSERIQEMFQNHNSYVNEKYSKISKMDCISDKERFVSRFFKKYIGKYIVLIDKEIVGLHSSLDNSNGYYIQMDRNSIYAVDNSKNDNYSSYCTPVTEVVKKYLKILSFDSVNRLYGLDYIKMITRDSIGKIIEYKLDLNMMNNAQFMYIESDVFDSVKRLFEDDRDDITFVAKRRLTFEEMVDKKIIRKNCKLDKVPKVLDDIEIIAKDSAEAAEKYRAANKTGILYTRFEEK